MTTDPVQLLIEAGAIPSSPFAPTSRYANVAVARWQRDAADPGVPYLRRRFVPKRSEIAVAARHIVHDGERPDTIAALALGDAELTWRIADANAVVDPFELTDTTGRRIAIPLPPGAV